MPCMPVCVCVWARYVCERRDEARRCKTTTTYSDGVDVSFGEDELLRLQLPHIAHRLHLVLLWRGEEGRSTGTHGTAVVRKLVEIIRRKQAKASEQTCTNLRREQLAERRKRVGRELALQHSADEDVKVAVVLFELGEPDA